MKKPTTSSFDLASRAIALLEMRNAPPGPEPEPEPEPEGPPAIQAEFIDEDEKAEEPSAPPPPPMGDGPGVNIAGDFTFPFEIVTQSIGIVAARGSGKTYLTTVMAEEFLFSGLPFLVIDPVGVYWGLRSGADGVSEGLDVYILGGDHGDVPLDPGSGKAVARWVTDYRRPVVLDMSLMRKNEQRLFVADLAEELYAVSKLPLHMIVDEADLFIPQRASEKEEKRVLASFEDIVRRGRVRGLGITVVTQRPAVIHKDILTQIGTLIVLRMLGPQDRKSIEEWIKFHGDPHKQRMVLSSLASLPIGTAWVWSPGWLGVLKRVAIRKKMTYDSSATPKTEEDRPPPPEYRNEVDVDALRVQLADAISHDPNDPTVLKARIAELEAALSDGGDGAGNSVVGKLQRRVAELEKRLLSSAPKIKSFDPAAFLAHVERLGETVDRIARGLEERGILSVEGEEPEKLRRSRPS